MCNIDKFAVAFIDILGTSEKLKKLTKLEPDNPYQSVPDEYSSLYKSNARTLKKFRDCFNSNVEQAKNNILAKHKHIPKLKIEIRLTIFSDSILIWTPLRCSKTEQECLNLCVLFAALGSSYLELLSDEVYFRGAVCFSHGHEIDGQYYGPGNLKAYETESTKVFFPRIIIDEVIYKILECTIKNAEHNPHDPGAQDVAELAQHNKSYLVKYAAKYSTDPQVTSQITLFPCFKHDAIHNNVDIGIANATKMLENQTYGGGIKNKYRDLVEFLQKAKVVLSTLST